MANQYMQEEDDAILKTYNRYPVVLDHGDGAYPVSYTHLTLPTN